MNAVERKAVTALAGVFSLRMFGLFLVLPLMALYANAFEGATPLMIGLALGIYGLTQAIFQIPFGMLSDRWGRKPLIIFGLLIFTAGSVVAALAESVEGIIMGRALQGSGAIAAVVLALVADLTREQQRTKAMALLGMSIGASFLLALMASPLLDQWIGMSGIFWLTAVLSIFSIGVVGFLVPSPMQNASDPGLKATKRYFLDVLRDAQLLRLDLGIFVLHMTLTALFVVIPFLIIEVLAVGRNSHWQVYIPVLLVSILLMVPLLILGMKRQRTIDVLRLAIAVLGLGFLILFAGGTTASGIVVGLGVFFIGFNLLEAMLPSLLTRIAPGYAKGTASGIYNTFEFLGVFIGGAIGGLMFGSFGATGVFGFCLASSLLWLALSVSGPKPELRDSVTVYIDPHQSGGANAIERDLRRLAGVDSVTVLLEEKIAYIRVDDENFDPKQLERIDGVASSSR